MTVIGRAQARGIIVTPAEAANEGVEHMLDRIQDVGANSVAVSPGLFLLVTPDDGVREPPLDLEGEARTLDRPLWGQKVQYLKGYSPYVPDAVAWKSVPFPPPTPAPEAVRVDYAAQIVRSARSRGLKSYIVTSPTLVPGLPGGQSFSSGQPTGDVARDRLVRVDGTVPSRAIAGQGCVNNPRIQAVARARLIDTLANYADATGLFTDWVEYTCYLPEDIFTCFCEHCAEKARHSGLDWAGVEAGVRRIWDGFGRISDADLRTVIEAAPESIADSFAILSGTPDAAEAARELFRFKARSVTNFFSSIVALTHELGSSVEVGANGFAPPWHEATGADFGMLSSVVPVVRCKLFTFHWPMMTRWLGEWLLKRNPALSPALVLAAAKTVYRVPTGSNESRRTLADYGMPAPDQPHPITMGSLVEKLQLAGRDVVPASRIEAYIHSYRPVGQFEQVLNAAESAGMDGVWVQRYGYLSDEKLEVTRAVWKTPAVPVEK